MTHCELLLTLELNPVLKYRSFGLAFESAYGTSSVYKQSPDLIDCEHSICSSILYAAAEERTLYLELWVVTPEHHNQGARVSACKITSLRRGTASSEFELKPLWANKKTQ